MKQENVEEAIRIARLVDRFLNKELNEQEKSELNAWISSSPENREFLTKLLDEQHLEWLATDLKRFDVAAGLNSTKSKFIASQPPVRRKFRRIWQVSAAAVLLCAFAFIYVIQNARWTSSTQIIEPGTHTATLILSNGRELSMAAVAEGQLAEESGVSISKTPGGQLVYKVMAVDDTGDPASAGRPVSYNTLLTARGQQYQVILPDGTSVWLNAASSLKFPSSFVNNPKRVVELAGEAFFEVASDEQHPFVVKTIGQEVEVIGTHFNISAYGDEDRTKTTLIEGRVRVHLLDKKDNRTLEPGQQAVTGDAGIQLKKDVDLEEIVAWKNGYFKFNESLQSIMTKISRWYNVDVVYENPQATDLEFGAKISRDKDLATLLKIIESAGGVRFKIEGRRVVVTK